MDSSIDPDPDCKICAVCGRAMFLPPTIVLVRELLHAVVQIIVARVL